MYIFMLSALLTIYFEYRLRKFIKISTSERIKFKNIDKGELISKVRMIQLIVLSQVILNFVLDIDVTRVITYTNSANLEPLVTILWLPIILMINHTIIDFYISDNTMVFPLGRTIELNQITEVESDYEVDNKVANINIKQGEKRLRLKVYANRADQFISCIKDRVINS